MKNYQFLFAAWATVWMVFLLYDISLGQRVGRLQDEVKRLGQRLSGADRG
jgi:hypothetical protein